MNAPRKLTGSKSAGVDVVVATAHTRPFALHIDGITLSGLLAEPNGDSRALLVALHGHGTTAQYFAGAAEPSLSLLELGASLGFTVWAPDRIGYGASIDAEPWLRAMAPQARLLSDAIDRYAEMYAVGAGAFLIGHSFGFKLALAMAAEPLKTTLIGIDGSSTGLDYAVPFEDWPPKKQPGERGPSWGPSHLYPPATFDPELRIIAPIATPPPSEGTEWPDDFRRLAPGIGVPVRFTIAEFDRLWAASDEHYAAIRALLTSAPTVEWSVQRNAGHNISVSWV
ncbi:MAG TPA: alpha/beta hydrolase, partial [Ilumatobacter sp.]|nr:alpha/beta hydrolase [Ilumatobacter sp.]